MELPKKEKDFDRPLDPEKIEQDIEKYLEMNILNPDWEFAARHGQASKPGRVEEGEEDRQECICCLKQINKSPIPLCENSKELEFLGLGFPLYFIFLKYAIVILLLQILNYSVMDLYFAVIENEGFCLRGQPRIVNGL